jgi:hypothetical protein
MKRKEEGTPRYCSSVDAKGAFRVGKVEGWPVGPEKDGSLDFCANKKRLNLHLGETLYYFVR